LRGRTGQGDSQHSCRKLRRPVAECIALQVGVVLVGEGLVLGLLHLPAVGLELSLVDGDFRGSKSNTSDEVL
jgi:hypothetical protein